MSRMTTSPDFSRSNTSPKRKRGTANEYPRLRRRASVEQTAPNYAARMKTILADDLPFIPAGHENPLDPQVWKKVLFGQADLQAGRVQMVNWARLPPGKQFAAHYHEDMQEIFVIIQGTAQIVVGKETTTLRPGNAVRIDPREVHRMKNLGDRDVEYLAVGISAQQGGRTMVVEDD